MECLFIEKGAGRQLAQEKRDPVFWASGKGVRKKRPLFRLQCQRRGTRTIEICSGLIQLEYGLLEGVEKTRKGGGKENLMMSPPGR